MLFSTISIRISEHAEPDAFFCFTHLMGEIKDNFQKTLDDSAFGIGKYYLVDQTNIHRDISSNC